MCRLKNGGGSISQKKQTYRGHTFIKMSKCVTAALMIMLCCPALLCACGKSPEETVTNRKIAVEDITEFYYTISNVNFNAFYQRYRFFREDGKWLFYHETREKPGEYGPATEEDITASGTVELSEEEWEEFLAFLKDGKVTRRTDTDESGSSGPWMFIYWKRDKGKYQVFNFSSTSEMLGFEAFCAELAQA